MSMDLERGQLLDAIDDVATRIARYDLERRLGARDGAPQPLPARRRRGSVLADVRRQHLMREAIRGHQRPSEAIRGHQLFSPLYDGSTSDYAPSDAHSDAIRRTPSMAINGHQWPSRAITCTSKGDPLTASPCIVT